jgi:hypothetical protein
LFGIDALVAPEYETKQTASRHQCQLTPQLAHSSYPITRATMLGPNQPAFDIPSIENCSLSETHSTL